MKDILSHYGFDEKDGIGLPFGRGLINRTWLLEAKGQQYILQKINDRIFRSPASIALNIRMVAEHLEKYHPGYLFVTPIKTLTGEDLLEKAGAYYRLFPFVKDSHTIDVVETPGQAYEAAKQFGWFTRNLSGLDITQLKITLPDFHDLSLRYRQFEAALRQGNKERIQRSKELIDFIFQHRVIADEFEHYKKVFTIRCTHHDTKISNVLFDSNDRGICVIDLDTLMPGYFISDLGDMMRTYLSPVSEEEEDFSKIAIRKEFYDAVINGYMSEMKDELSTIEKEHFRYAGKFMIYMQAIRFLTDHINDDFYYGASYEGHNFVRAGNQVDLLKKLMKFLSIEK